MGVFDRLTNPVWYDVSRLDKRRQRIAAFLITGYGSCRHQINQFLIAPLNQKGMIQLPSAIQPGTRERLIDEALVGFLKSCRIPQSDPTGIVPSQVVQNVAEVWGVFALADSNHRLKRTKPDTLKGSSYSSDPDEARTQVLVKWAEILGLIQTDFVMDANKHWFLEQWSSMTAGMIAGSLTGFGRVPDEIALRRARNEAADLPAYQIAKARYMIQAIAKAPLSSSEPKERRVPGNLQPSLVAEHAQKITPSAGDVAFENKEEKQLVIQLASTTEALMFLRLEAGAMFVNITAKEREACKDWASTIRRSDTIEVLSWGLARFFWDREGNIPAITSLLRREYPERKAFLNVALTHEISSIFRSWTAQRVTALEVRLRSAAE